MRNPFRLKNSIEQENRQIAGTLETLDFEESLKDHDRGLVLEREGGANKFNLGALTLFLLIIFGLIFARLYYLTILKHGYYREIADGNRLRIEYLPAPRGAVYDAFSQVLSANQPSFELVASPLDLPKISEEAQKIIQKVADILQIKPQEIQTLLNREDQELYESILVKQNLTREQALIFHEQAQDLPGFRVVNTPIRSYYQPQAFAHLLGFVGKIDAEEYKEKSSLGYQYNDTLGKSGLELWYEEYLRGDFGQRQVEVDARGAVKKIFGKKEPLPGQNLHLNIDAALQEKLFLSLQKRLFGLGRKRAAAIAMDPRSGRILAFISLPSFDNNLFAQGISAAEFEKLASDRNEPLFNRAIAGTYPPGSTVKPMVAAAALEEGVIGPKEVILDKGEIVVRNPFGGPDYYFYGYNRKPLGFLDVRKAIALSSDVFFYIVGGGYEPAKISGLGIDRLAAYFKKFHLGEKLGIDLPGEQAGLVPTPAWKKTPWYLGDTYHVAIGQGDLLVSPLQILSWTATLANGGKIYRPFIVERIEDNEGTAVKEFAPEVIGELGIQENYLELVRAGMRQAVTEGSAKSLNDLPIAVAGKTGTAQFDARNPYRTHAWFSAFAPYHDPQIAIVVLVENGGEGSLSAAPVVKGVLEWWARERYLGKQ